jgi:hypothetical protein
MLARAWFTAQFFPLPKGCERQINKAVAWFVWRGEIFRFPLFILQGRKQQAGWGLINVAAKFRTILHFRLQAQSQDHDTLTAIWFRTWNIQMLETNPPQIQQLPLGMGYMSQYVAGRAYIAQQGGGGVGNV